MSYVELDLIIYRTTYEIIIDLLQVFEEFSRSTLCIWVNYLLSLLDYIKVM